jgi:hypothetical protein
MIFGNNGVAFGIADYSARLLVGVVSMIGRLTLGVFVIAGRKALVEGPRTVGAARWLKAQTTNFVKKFHMLIGPHSTGAERILKALIIYSLRALRTNVVPRIIATICVAGRKCDRLIVKTKSGKRSDMTQNIKNNSEAPS